MKRLIFFVIFIVCFCFHVSAITLSEAKALAVGSDYPKALKAFKDLIAQPKYAKNPECNKFYGQCLCMTGDYSQSIPYLEQGCKGGVIGAWWYLGISRQHLYDFEGAIAALEKYKTYCSERSGWIPRTDSIIAECELGLRAISRVQDVVIIDSMIVEKKHFFDYYKLGAESGHLISPNDCGGVFAEMCDSAAVIFENVGRDYRLMTCQDEADGSYGLYAASFFENEWCEPEKIKSVGSEKHRLLYPFQRSDGETLYFACDSTPGFGGLDIYMTHYNSDADAYYSPTRLGMPFNSPYNDYMMAFDETNQVGWWATERCTAADSVCIYIFLSTDDVDCLTGKNVSRARIDRIADTWGGENIEAIRQQIYNPQLTGVNSAEDAFIPIREGVVYHSINDFKVPEAKTAYQLYLQIKEDLCLVKQDLQDLREQYGRADAEGKKSLKMQILQKESRVLTLSKQLKEAAKNYRNLEKP